MNQCPFCGLRFSDEAAASGCRGCVFRHSCAKRKCPRCGYEIPGTPGIVKWFLKRRRWRGGRHAR